jgi:hypothetical protein
MNKALLPIVACLGTTAVVLTTGTVANPDTATVIPYPEVINLKRVPIFNDKGMVAQSPTAVKIATKVVPEKVVKDVVPPTIVTKVQPERIVKDVILPVKMAVNKPSQQHSAKKMRELLLKHQTLAEIVNDGKAAPVEN